MINVACQMFIECKKELGESYWRMKNFKNYIGDDEIKSFVWIKFIKIMKHNRKLIIHMKLNNLFIKFSNIIKRDLQLQRKELLLILC